MTPRHQADKLQPGTDRELLKLGREVAELKAAQAVMAKELRDLNDLLRGRVSPASNHGSRYTFSGFPLSTTHNEALKASRAEDCAKRLECVRLAGALAAPARLPALGKAGASSAHSKRWRALR